MTAEAAPPVNLLVVTQRVDLESDVLGFVHTWLEKLAEPFDAILAVALYRGETRLPPSVTVASLGKETGRARPLSVLSFWGHIWRERRRYDAVLVHMTPIFVVLGWPFWRAFGKRVLLWYNHRQGGLLAWTAIRLSDAVLYTSRFAYSSQFAHAREMPAGVSTELFRRDDGVDRPEDSLLYLGRLSPVKNVECLVEAARLLHDEGVSFRLEIVGSPAVASDHDYVGVLHEASREMTAAGNVRYAPGVPNSDTPRVYNAHELCINLTGSGSFDKTILEAMACESLVLVANRSFEGVLPDGHLFAENDARDLASKIRALLALTPAEKRDRGRALRQIVVERHGVERLAEAIYHAVVVGEPT